MRLSSILPPVSKEWTSHRLVWKTEIVGFGASSPLVAAEAARFVYEGEEK
jgi:hypothetical protein